MAAIDGKTAKRYAKALFELCNPDTVEQMREALRTFAEAWDESEELRTAMPNPSISQSEKLAVITEIAQQIKPEDESFSNFLSLLLTNNRLAGVGEVNLYFSTMIDEMRNRLAVEVTSAFELSAEEKSSVTTRIQSDSGKEASVSWKVDPSIIGGLMIQTGDKLLDSSIRGSLDKVRSRLVA